MKRKYVIFPQSYNLKDIVYLIQGQKVEALITEPEMLMADVPNVFICEIKILDS